jgi:hypothetical protein
LIYQKQITMHIHPVAAIFLIIVLYVYITIKFRKKI